MNKVQAGRFKNKRVSVKKEWLRIHLGWKDCLLLTPGQYYLYRKNNISRRNCIDFNNQCTIPCCVDFKKHSHILKMLH